ncbi:MAG: MotA/TolQ/ExbB proton channel family protein [Flavobacteriaceae bacterium]|nr:MotA/TolQ/ExbB proton channel family protein [Flavobacteriaceae bacterium]
MLFKLFEQGGTVFMTPILILFILCAVLFVRELIQKNNKIKTITLLKSLSVFVLVWGACGQVIGLIEAFDSMEGIKGSVSSSILYGGLKFTFLSTLFGMITFLFARVYIVILQWKEVKV